MISEIKNPGQLDDLVNFLRIRREVILNIWRELCTQDQNLSSKAGFSREEFNDQVPVLLNILEQRMLQEPESEDAVQISNEHGLHRWQSGYELHELIIEFEHLYKIIMEQVKRYLENNQDFSD